MSFIVLTQDGADARYTKLADLQNPETTASSRITAIATAAANAALAGFDPTKAAQTIYIGANLATARPTTSTGAKFPGVVIWLTTVDSGGATPNGIPSVPANALSGDLVCLVSVQTLPWNPTMLASALVVCDAKLQGGTDATALAQFNDMTTAGHHFKQATSTKQPIYQAAAFGAGYPGLKFDGTDDIMSTDAFTDYTGAFTVYAIIKSNLATATASKFAWDGVSTAASAQKLGFYQSGASPNRWTMQRGVSLGSTTNTADNVIHRVKAVYNGASSEIQLDGTVIATGSTTGSSLDVASLVLGARGDANNFWNGWIGHFTAVQGVRADGDADDTKMVNWLKANWPVS